MASGAAAVEAWPGLFVWLLLHVQRKGASCIPLVQHEGTIVHAAAVLVP